MPAELFLNGSIDHQDGGGTAAIWRTPGQLALDMGASGMRIDSHTAYLFDDPASDGPSSFLQANIDRAAALGLKVSLIMGPSAVRSAAWEALGGDWDGWIPTETDWRALRIPNVAGVNAAVLNHSLGTLAYAVAELGEDNVQVEIGNEPRHVTRTGGVPTQTASPLEAWPTNLLQVADASGFEVLMEKAGGYIIVESTPRQYVRVEDVDLGTDIITTTTVVNGSGGNPQTIRLGDHYDNDGEVDLDYMAQISGLIVGLKADFPNVRMWGPTFFQLGLDSVQGIKDYLDFFAGLSGVTYPGFALLDGFAINLYPLLPSGRLDIETWVQKGVAQAQEAIAYARTKNVFGLDTKPFAIQEVGASGYELRMTTAGVPRTERHRARALNLMLERLCALSPDVDRVALYGSRSGNDDGSIASDSYEFIDVNGKVSVGLVDLARTRVVSSTVAPSGYANSGAAYLGATGAITPV